MKVVRSSSKVTSAVVAEPTSGWLKGVCVREKGITEEMRGGRGEKENRMRWDALDKWGS